jgi:hypothetical protein
MRLWAAIGTLLALSYGMALANEEYSFDLSEIEEKPLHIGGYLEFRPVLFGLDKSSALYKFKSYDRNEGNIREEYNFTSLLDGSYKKGTTEFETVFSA